MNKTLLAFILVGETMWNSIYVAVFQVGEAGFKLFCTMHAQTWCNRSYLVKAIYYDDWNAKGGIIFYGEGGVYP